MIIQPNKREFFRLEHSATFEYRMIRIMQDYIENTSEKIKSHIYNISGGGLIFSVQKSIIITDNEYIFGELLLSNTMDFIPIIGNKVRQLPHPIDLSRTLVAIQFLEITTEDQDKIVEYINRKVVSQ
jgi:c-di-GMP-binding flagellar brake protein YcgR